MAEYEQVRQKLVAQLEDLERRAGRVQRDLAEPLNADSSEAAVEQEDDEALEREGELALRQMASIKRALRRIEEGSYGACVRCGADIALARLAARPEAALCIRCASAEERH